MELGLSGSVNTEKVNTRLEAAGVELSQESTRVEAEMLIGLDSTPAFQGGASLDMNGFALQMNNSEEPMVRLASLTINSLKASGGQSLTVEEIVSRGLTVDVEGDMPLTVVLPEMKLTELKTEDLKNFAATGVQLDKLAVNSKTNGQLLAGFSQLGLSAVSYGENQQVGVEKLSLSDLVFLEESEQVSGGAVNLGLATLEDLKWGAEAGLHGGKLTLSDLVGAAVRDKDGEINITKALAAMRTSGDQEEAAVSASIPLAQERSEVDKADSQDQDAGDSSAATEQKMVIVLGEISVDGESKLSFSDFTLAVPYITELNIEEMRLVGLDSTQPEKPSELLLRGSLENRAPLELTGDIAPFMDTPTMNLKLKLKNYPLKSLSAYTVQSVGTALASGQLKLKTKLQIADNNLDMNNTVTLKKLETETISKELAEELNNQLPIPLDTALAILRDNEQNITLDIPLSGPVSDLNVGISDVLITALSKAIVPAASGYLMYTLGPYGALAYVGVKVGEKLLQVKLPPVEYPPGDAALSPEHHDYLERVAKVLSDRPETDLQLCPQVAAWEFLNEEEKGLVKEEKYPIREQDKEGLTQLGQDRAEGIKNYLATSHSISEDRLLICDTIIETEKKSVPMVLLQM